MSLSDLSSLEALATKELERSDADIAANDLKLTELQTNIDNLKNELEAHTNEYMHQKSQNAIIDSIVSCTHMIEKAHSEYLSVQNVENMKEAFAKLLDVMCNINETPNDNIRYFRPCYKSLVYLLDFSATYLAKGSGFDPLSGEVNGWYELIRTKLGNLEGFGSNYGEWLLACLRQREKEGYKPDKQGVQGIKYALSLLTWDTNGSLPITLRQKIGG